MIVPSNTLKSIQLYQRFENVIILSNKLELRIVME
jgi:hypothetical protein